MQMTFNKTLRYIASTVLLVGLGLGCGAAPDESEGSDSLAEYSAALADPIPREFFSGTVTNKSGTPVANAAVSINGSKTTTSTTGYFELYTPRSDRYAIGVTKSGYVPESLIHIGLSLINMDIKLKQAEAFTFNPTQPFTATDSRGTQISLPAGALVNAQGQPATGTLTLNLYTYKLQEEAMVGDMSGVDTSGAPVVLQSLGAFSADFTDAAGKLYNLAPGKTASVSMPIDPENNFSGPVPIWSYNPSDAKWHEEGTGNVVNGLATAQVPHFSLWNFDIKGISPACVRVTVDPAYLYGSAVSGKLNLRLEVPSPWSRILGGDVQNPLDNVFINLPPNTDVKAYVKGQLYAVVNTGNPWGGVGAPPHGSTTPFYPACNGVLHVDGTPKIGTITGAVSLEGRTNHSGVVVTAWNGSTAVAAAKTNAAGSYSLSVPPGTYTITADQKSYLDGQKASVSVAPGGTTTLTSVTLLAGDVDENNCVDWSGDISPIGNNLNTTVPPTGDPKDVNGDGTITNTDLSLAFANLGKCEPISWP